MNTLQKDLELLTTTKDSAILIRILNKIEYHIKYLHKSKRSTREISDLLYKTLQVISANKSELLPASRKLLHDSLLYLIKKC